MDIKLVVFDLDGTAIPVEFSGLPSKRVVDVVNESKKYVKVAAATGRPFYNASKILSMLSLTEPCIVSGGSQIVDPRTGEVLWEKMMAQESVEAVLSIIKDLPYKIYTSDNPMLLKPGDISDIKSERVIFIMYVEKSDALKMVADLREIKDVDAHAMASWEKGKMDVHVTHISATKKNAMAELLRMLNVSKENVMSVGDGGNDLPLFELSGFKVAMGNAGQDLKARADAVTLSVEEDGLAEALTQYVIKNGKIRQ
jgi:Cof subfamily protein (haloacid dehalogenase superfamily)